MAQTTTFKVHKRRKREGKTNYKKRLTLLLSHRPRFVVRKSHNHVLVQLVEYSPDGDHAVVSAHSKELKKFGFKGHTGNSKAAYLAGYLGGKRALKGGFENPILDIGLVSSVKGSSVFAALLGALDAGCPIPHHKDILPARERFADLEKIKEKIDGDLK